MSDNGVTRQDLLDMEERLYKHMREMEERLVHRLEKVETTLLTEFHKWASPLETRMRTHRSWFYEVDAEVEALKQRISKLEKGTNPAQ